MGSTTSAGEYCRRCPFLMSLIPTAWRPVLEVLVGVMTAGCVVPYIRDILRGKT